MEAGYRVKTGMFEALVVLLMVSMVCGTECGSNDLQYHFTECVNNRRKGKIRPDNLQCCFLGAEAIAAMRHLRSSVKLPVTTPVTLEVIWPLT